MSQRAYPTMALIQPSMDLSNPDGPASLFLNAPGMEELEVKVPPADCKPTDTVKYVAGFHTGPFVRGGLKILCSSAAHKKNLSGIMHSTASQWRRKGGARGAGAPPIFQRWGLSPPPPPPPPPPNLYETHYMEH